MSDPRVIVILAAPRARPNERKTRSGYPKLNDIVDGQHRIAVLRNFVRRHPPWPPKTPTDGGRDGAR